MKQQAQHIVVAERHLQAAVDKKWDYPKGGTFKTADEVTAALRDGKTIEEVYYECIARFGTITGGVYAGIFGHISNSTRSAVRKGIKQILN